MKWMICALVSVMVSSAFAQDLYQVKEKDITGKDFDMKSLKGKVVLVVNIASQCGYTPQLESLEAVYNKYKAKNFVVLGVPTNDFGGQTPEDDAAIKEFCSKNYNVTFPILKKQTVVGKDKRPLYKYIGEKSPGDMKWNFEKILFNKEGKIVDRFPSKVAPFDAPVIKKIESLL